MVVTQLPIVYVTYEEAAFMLGKISKRTVGRKVKSGELEKRGDGKGARIVFESVIRHPSYMASSQGGQD